MADEWMKIWDGVYDSRLVTLFRYEDEQGDVFFKVKTVQKSDAVGESYRDGDSVVEGGILEGGEPIEVEASSQPDLHENLVNEAGFSTGDAREIAYHAI